MQKRKQVSKIIFRLLAGFLGFGLFVACSAIFYTYHSSNQSLDKLLPSEVDYVVELQPDQFAEKIIKQKWGEQGAKVAYSNGRIISWQDENIFCHKKISENVGMEVLYYRGFEIQNLPHGENYWQVVYTGWTFESDQDTLRKLVDFWLNDEEKLAQNNIWNELKSSVTEGVLNVFILKNPENINYWQGTSLSLQGNNLQILTLLDRGLLQDFDFGKSREKYKGELLPYANNDSWLVVGGQDLAQQFRQVSQIISKFNPQILRWLKFNYSMPKLFNDEQILAWVGDNVQNQILPSKDIENELFYNDFQKYATGAERWIALIYPQKNPKTKKFIENIINFVPEFIFVGQQIFDDRILTTIHFE